MGAIEVRLNLYQKMVGNFFYFTNSRPYIFISVGVLSHFMNKP